jgi:hypothetical protein
MKFLNSKKITSYIQLLSEIEITGLGDLALLLLRKGWLCVLGQKQLCCWLK